MSLRRGTAGFTESEQEKKKKKRTMSEKQDKTRFLRIARYKRRDTRHFSYEHVAVVCGIVTLSAYDITATAHRAPPAPFCHSPPC